ncbi:MAG TPA: hypothetical protein VFP28_04760, partial [Gemmatimonadales bacterium]|nr:hypothetical protein [Gemmatimonadales bacterium]
MAAATLLTLARAAAAAAALISFGQAPEPDVHYRLRTRVDDSAGLVTGRGEVAYRHLGPDTLRSLLLSLVSRVVRLAPSDSGFTAEGVQRISQVRINGMPAALVWPEANESTSVRVELAEPLLAGDSVLLTFDWETRAPSPRSNGMPSGRRLDLLAWYPRLLDETSRTSVPIPALATVLLAVDLPADQVVAGTGVPLCGNPGWARAAATPRTLVTLQRDWYRRPRDPEAAAVSCEGASPGRNRVTWYAEDVSGIALSMSPTFRYEEGDFLDRPVHVLYETGEERAWGAGLASRRTETALAWVLELTGPYPWPHITVVQGLGSDGQAAAMLLLPEASSQAAILNLLGLMITHELLPGGAPLFAVGAAAFQTAWFFEVLGRRGEYTQLERSILDWDLDGLARVDEPLRVAGSTSPCSSTYCRRTELTFYQLRWWAGGDAAMRDLFRALYQRFVLRATIPGSFQRLARERILPNPDPLYEQLPRGGTLYDDAIAKAWRARIENGHWRTTVVVERRAAGRFPQTIWVVARGDTGVARAAALTPSETLSVVTRTPPARVLLDPLAQSHDWNMLNNQHAFGFRPRWLVLTPNRPTQTYLDTYFTRQVARDRATLGWSPTAWYNDAGGWTFGGRLREDYLGRFEQNEAWASL